MGKIGENKDKGKVTFSQWMRDTGPNWIYEGRGVSNAYKYGAEAIFGCRDFGQIYHRSDCVRAEREGRQDAQATIEGGVLTVLCDCCLQPFPAFKQGYSK